MSRLIFEDDEVIREALMMDTDSNDDCHSIDKQPISSEVDNNESTMKHKEIQNALKINTEEKSINREMYEKQNSETKHQCQNCLQKFEKKELQNHDCGKKKRKSLVLTFHKNLSLTSSLNVTGIRKSDIKNDSAQSDVRKSIDSSTIGKNNHKKSSINHDKNNDLDLKDQDFEKRKSETPIFYECPKHVQHFAKKEFGIHYCKDKSPCLTLRFSRSSSFNDSVEKYPRNKSNRAKVPVDIEEILKTNESRGKIQANHKRDNSMPFSTKVKQPIDSQHFEKEKTFKKLNQPIALQNDTKTMKRKYLVSEKGIEKEVYEPKPKNIKIVKHKNKTNKSENTTFEGNVGDVNRIEAIETPSQSTTKKTAHPNSKKDTSKNENSVPSKTVNPKTIFGNKKSEIQRNQVRTSSNKKPIDKKVKRKITEISCIGLHKIDTELNQTILNKRILRSTKQITAQSEENKQVNKSGKLLRSSKQITQSEERKEVNTSDNLPNHGEMLPSTDIMSKKNGKSSKYGYNHVLESQKLPYRFNERKVQHEKETKETGCQNLENTKANVVPSPDIQDGDTKIETSHNQKEDVGDNISKNNEKSLINITASNKTSETYKMIRLDEMKVLIQKEATENRNEANERIEAVDTTRNEPDSSTGNKISNKQKEAKQIEINSQSEERKKDINSDKIFKRGEISSQSKDRTSKRDEKSQNVVAEKYKIFRFNELKVLLEKEKQSTGCQNLVNIKADVVNTINKQDSFTENVNYNNQKQSEVNQNFENVVVDLTLNENNSDIEPEKSIKMESSQEENSKSRINKKIKRAGLQNKYKVCRLCHTKYRIIKHYKHICKSRKTKPKRYIGQILKKSDAISKSCKNNSQSKINITILSRENVKIVTVSNNAKDYEVNQGDISNYLQSDPTSTTTKQNEIKETTEQVRKSSTGTISQSELSNIAEDEAFEKEKGILDVTGKTELILSLHRNADTQNSNISLNEFSVCEESSKTQENEPPLPEPNISLNEFSVCEEISKIQENGPPLPEPNITLNEFSVCEESSKTQENEQHLPEPNLTLSEFSVCEKNSKIQENEPPLPEPNISLNEFSVCEEISKIQENGPPLPEPNITLNEFSVCEESSKTQENEQHLPEPNLTLSEFSVCEKNSKIQENEPPLPEPNITLNELSVCEESSKTQENEQHLPEPNITLNELSVCEESSKTQENEQHLPEPNITLNELSICEESSKTQENEQQLPEPNITLNELSVCKESSKTQENEQHLPEPNITLNEFSVCEESSKTKEKEPPLPEPRNLNKNGKDDNKRLIKNSKNNSNSTEIANTILCQISDHSYSITNVESNMSINTVDGENAKSTQNLEHSYSVSEENIISIHFEVQEIEKSNYTDEKDIIVSMNDVESDITVPEIVGSETIIPESTLTESEVILLENVGREVTILEREGSEVTESESEITISECEITLSANVESDESIKTEITLPDSQITLPEIVESQITVTTQNENTSSIQNINIENFTNQIIGIDCDIIISNDNVGNEVIVATRNEGIDNNEMMLKDVNISNDNVLQEIIIPAKEEEIPYDQSEIVSADVENHVVIATQINNESLVSIENIEQEVIITNENKEIDDVSIENVVSSIVLTEKDENVVVIQNADNIVESTESGRANNRIEEIEKVSVESLENEAFVANIVLEDSIKDVQIEASVPTISIKASDSNVQTNENNISKQDEISVSIQTNTNVLTKNVELCDSVEDEQNETDVSTKYVAPTDSVNDINKSTQSNVLVENMTNANAEVTKANQNHSTVDVENENVLVQNELILSKKEGGVLSSQSGNSERVIPTNDEIETIIIISSEEENKKNIVFTQNEKNETVIIISKNKEKLSGDHNTVPSRIEEITIQDHQTEHEKNLNNHKCCENTEAKEKEGSLSIETQLPAFLNQTDSQNEILETGDENNKQKEDNSLESKLAAILNQNESQNKMALTQEHRNDNMSNENNGCPITKNQLLDILSKNTDDIYQIEKSNIINHDILQKENSFKTKCFRCSKEFTDRELTTHNCLKKPDETDKNSQKTEKITTEVAESVQNHHESQNDVLYVIEIKENSDSVKETNTDRKIQKIKCIRCFNCSEIYDKTHKCTNTQKETDSNNKSSGKLDINSQDEIKTGGTVVKKNKYYFDRYILKTKHGAYRCKICKKEYTARKNLVRHIHKHEKEYDTEKFKCSLCPKTYEYKASLKSHEKSHTGEMYVCDICDKTFTRKTNLYTHMKLHGDVEKITCEKCGKEYSSQNCYDNHPCFNIKEYLCNLCKKTYKQKHNLIDHLHSHAGFKSYMCEFCNKKFTFRGTFRVHTYNCALAKQHVENNQEITVEPNQNKHLSCKFCPKILKNKSELQKHEWRHQNSHFFCNICSKKFKSKHYLQLHLANHDELGIERKKFECSLCDKNFSTKFGLKLHFNIHTGVKFPCPICEKLFSTKLLLKTHEKTHTGQTPYVCINCNKAFNNRSNFNRHKNNKVCYFTPIET